MTSGSIGRPDMAAQWPAGPPHYGPFEVLLGDNGFPQELGAGSMGVTDLGRDNVLRRTVA